ncbi:MAG: hypothetical protein ACREC6_12150, partial [Hyphomicrobiaceae bacterium]
VDCHTFGMSGSIMHVASGLYVSASYGFIEDDNRKKLFRANLDDPFKDVDGRDEHWYIQAGIEKKFFALGKTTIYGEYGRFDAGAGITATGQILNVTSLTPTGISCGDVDGEDAACPHLLSSKVDMWGFGVVQSIDAAAMDLYVQFRKFDVDATVTNLESEEETLVRRTILHGWYGVKAGAIIRF